MDDSVTALENGAVLVEEDPELEVTLGESEPPEALNHLPNITSQVMLAIVASSLENIKDQIAAEKEVIRKAEEALKEAAEAEAAEGKGKEKAAEEIPEDGPAAPEENRIPLLVLPPPETEKRQKRRFGITRMLRHMKETMGETSAAGAARHYSEGGGDGPALASPSRAFLSPKHKKSKEMEAPVETVECISCLDDVPAKTAVATPCHHYCKDCFERLISAAMDDEARWPPKCCLNQIPVRTIAKNTSSELMKRFKAKDEEYKTAIDVRVYCSQPDCGLYIKRDLLNLASKTARCAKGHKMCLVCRQPAHPADSACPRDRDQQLADELAETEGWRRCYRCKLLIEHSEACQHMTCRCGAEFCYVCGARWHTCLCTMDQLRSYKEAAEARHRARRLEEDEEERELQEALRLIAAFEREQQLKADLLRKELERVAEERRIKEEADRQRREAARLAAMEEKHMELTETLNTLNELQRVVFVYSQDRAREEARTHAEETRVELSKRQETEKVELRAAAAARLAELQHGWDRDYQARIAAEQRLEDEYRAKLQHFWAKRSDGAAQMRAALREYMLRNDRRFEAYTRWRDGEMDKFRFHVDDELGIREELLDATRARLDELLAGQEHELRRRLKAERKWFEVVTAERVRLLEELKDVERHSAACDLDSDLSSTSEADDEFIDAEEWPLPRRRI